MNASNLVVSRNEFDFLLTRAGAGIGLPFGIAEDFAQAVIWASRCDLDPAGAGRGCLEALDSNSASGKISWHLEDATVVIEGHAGLSAALAVSAVADFWQAQPEGSNAIVVRQVDQPLLLVAVLAIAGVAETSVVWEGVRAELIGQGRVDIFAPDQAVVLRTAQVDVAICGSVKLPVADAEICLTHEHLEKMALAGAVDGLSVDTVALAAVQKLFRRYLVPSNEQSRLSGAGAGLSDSD